MIIVNSKVYLVGKGRVAAGRGRRREKKMKDGFFRAAAVTPEIRVADPEYNREQICRLIEEGAKSAQS